MAGASGPLRRLWPALLLAGAGALSPRLELASGGAGEAEAWPKAWAQGRSKANHSEGPAKAVHLKKDPPGAARRQPWWRGGGGRAGSRARARLLSHGAAAQRHNGSADFNSTTSNFTNFTKVTVPNATNATRLTGQRVAGSFESAGSLSQTFKDWQEPPSAQAPVIPPKWKRCVSKDEWDRNMADWEFGTAHAPMLTICQDEPKPRRRRTQEVSDFVCCNDGEYSGECEANTSCACEPYAYPSRILATQIRHATGVLFFDPKAARHLLRGKRLFFVGDSTTRRLMYAFCSFLGEKTFSDRHPGKHEKLVCPEEGYEDNDVNKAAVDMQFYWAPQLQDLEEDVVDIRRESFKSDYVITSVHHFDRLKAKKAIGPPPAKDVIKAITEISHGDRDLPAEAIIVSPNLVSPSAHSKRINKFLLKYADELEEGAQGYDNVTVVSNHWMRAGMEDDDRAKCLGSTIGHGIHIRNEHGQIMRVNSLLAKMAVVQKR